MRVLHLISSGGMYGAEAVILNLSRGLRALGHESLIASFGNASDQLHQKALAEGFSSILLPCKGQLDLACVRRIRSVASSENLDVVHAHGYKADLYAWAALRGRGKALVSTCHTWYDNDLSLRLYGALDRFVLRRFQSVVAVSRDVERRLRQSGVRQEQIRQIRNGIDLKPFNASAAARGTFNSKRTLTVGLVGRLAPEKGVDIFLEAASILAHSHTMLRFVVFGEGPERANLQAQVMHSGLQDCFVMAGKKDDMQEVYAGLDLLVSASRHEGLPIALLEGMASGLPVVGTTVGEVPAVVRHGETGLLVSSEDPCALAEAMSSILEDEGKRLRFGRAARQWVEQEFSAERMTREYLEVYSSALNQVRSQ